MKQQCMERLQKKGFHVRQITSPVDFLKAWNEAVVSTQLPVVALNDPVTSLWLDRYENVRWIPDDGGRQHVFSAQLGFTGASLVLAQTGTLLLAEDSGYARLVSNMVPRHVALIPEDRIVTDWKQALDRVRREAGRIPRIMSWISGPSQTADIHGTLVQGMHGPIAVEAWIVPAMAAASLILT